MTDKPYKDALKNIGNEESKEFEELKGKLKEASEDGSTTGSKTLDQLAQEANAAIIQAHLQRPEGSHNSNVDLETNKAYQLPNGEWIVPSIDEALDPKKIRKNTGKSFADIFKEIKNKNS